ncbi:hypothetical protein PPL_07305 [Heterostelium album PN500]|uniref:Right handed beta helix domain-containing protein n=1 Tax=Heterostelium pallidum (strain ATCC 26659 / Pp 5 / PN500) TaxID=670386 RepID=D3BEY9_HETP5|nr:hypothetical protein PPL_07305 [Heterostelium album PN500]EFA80470.1 hypothetical protein PPL_07305 [Heterostelium album PN500]|eukprot:XP_020432590.1 hypothetical protein PPL_07305 [Heterostelium album PN500]
MLSASTIYVAAQSTTIYIDAKSTNDSLSCGTDITTPCNSLKSGIAAYNNLKVNTPLVLSMNQGNYGSPNNTDLNLYGMNVAFQQTTGAIQTTFIDLSQNSQFITVVDPVGGAAPTVSTTTSIAMNGIYVANGNATNGGFIQISTNTNVSLSIVNCEIKSHTASQNGGAIYVQSEANYNNVQINIQQSQIGANKAAIGAFIFTSNNTQLYINGTSIFLNNATSSSVIALTGGNFTFNQITYNGNNILAGSHFVFNQVQAASSVSQSTFNENQMATPNKGPISSLLSASFSVVTFNNNVFTNTLNLDVIYANLSLVNINYCNFTLGISSESIVHQDTSALSIQNCLFSNNTVSQSVVYGYHSNQLEVSNCTFANNTFSSSNGSYEIVVNQVQTVTIKNNNFERSTSESSASIGCTSSAITVMNNTNALLFFIKID